MMLEYRIYKNSFSSAEMRGIWSEQATISAWLKVEQVLARVQAEEGIIPAEAANTIESLNIMDLDHDALVEEMALVGRPIVGLVKQLRCLAGGHAAHVHYKSTTQDIMDTALAMQMNFGLKDVFANLTELLGVLNTHIQAHPDTLIMGRTNGQHAVPMRLSNKLLSWRSELERRAEAIEQAASRGLNVQVGGPVGDLRGYENDDGAKVKSGVAAKLGLGYVDPHWQNARDGIADIVVALGTLCGTLCKIAHNVNLLSSSDIGEVSEVHVDGKGTSSSMHHKRNQRSSEFLEAVSRLGRQKAEQIGEFTLHQHERSGGVWIGEWLIVPDAFLLTSGAMSWAQTLFAGLHVDAEKMALLCR